MTKKKGEYKSEFERQTAAYIAAKEGKVSYEKTYFTYMIEHRYTPDFQLKNGIYIETKGEFKAKDRTKHLEFRKQYPKVDLRLVFQSASNKLAKNSKTTYAGWCEKHNFKWAEKHIPEEWFMEKKK